MKCQDLYSLKNNNKELDWYVKCYFFYQLFIFITCMQSVTLETGTVETAVLTDRCARFLPEVLSCF